MKSEKNVGKSRNARLNRARKHVARLSELLLGSHGIPHNQLLAEADFWNEARSLASEICQCVHEANAYNNCIADDGAAFEEEDLYSLVAKTG